MSEEGKVILPESRGGLTIPCVISLHLLQTQAQATTFLRSGHWSSLDSSLRTISPSRSGSSRDHRSSSPPAGPNPKPSPPCPLSPSSSPSFPWKGPTALLPLPAGSVTPEEQVGEKDAEQEEPFLCERPLLRDIFSAPAGGKEATAANPRCPGLPPSPPGRRRRDGERRRGATALSRVLDQLFRAAAAWSLCLPLYPHYLNTYIKYSIIKFLAPLIEYASVSLSQHVYIAFIL